MTLENLVAGLLMVIPIATLVLLRARHETMSLSMTVGLFLAGASAMLMGFALLDDEPCTRFKLMLRAVTLAISMLLILWSMLHKRRDYSRHGDPMTH